MSTMVVNGKRALVTGSVQGIGLAIAFRQAAGIAAASRPTASAQAGLRLPSSSRSMYAWRRKMKIPGLKMKAIVVVAGASAAMGSSLFVIQALTVPSLSLVPDVAAE